MNKKTHERLFHLVKRTDIDKKQAWIVRGIIFIVSIFVCAIVSCILSEKSMGFFFKNFFDGIFGTGRKIWNLLHETAIILLISLAVTPCFKMKFWNIGGEGQILMGALGSAAIINAMGKTSPTAGTVVVALIVSLAFGIVWAVIPAIFKALWNTNETLLTLMMNYIAVCVVDYFIKVVDPNGTGSLNFRKGVIGPLGNEFVLGILIAIIITVIVAIYLKYAKHGYELSVVGESSNTARYIGINTKKVIIRTLILCGAMCGLVGFMLVTAINHGINSDSVGGRGFTGVLISWLGHFNPAGIALCSFVFVFFSRGAIQVGNLGRLGGSFANIITGIFLFLLIASEFFINYSIKQGETVGKLLAKVKQKINGIVHKPSLETAGTVGQDSEKIDDIVPSQNNADLSEDK